MNREPYHFNNHHAAGFGLVEVVVGIGIIGVLLFSLGQIGQLALRTILHASSASRALFLAQEGTEALRILRDQSWGTNIAPLATTTTYYINFDGASFTLPTAPPALIDSTFTRTLAVEDVFRDGSDDIAPSGTLDTKTKKITVTVSWDERGTTTQEHISLYLADLFQN